MAGQKKPYWKEFDRDGDKRLNRDEVHDFSRASVEHILSTASQAEKDALIHEMGEQCRGAFPPNLIEDWETLRVIEDKGAKISSEIMRRTMALPKEVNIALTLRGLEVDTVPGTHEKMDIDVLPSRLVCDAANKALDNVHHAGGITNAQYNRWKEDLKIPPFPEHPDIERTKAFSDPNNPFYWQHADPNADHKIDQKESERLTAAHLSWVLASAPEDMQANVHRQMQTYCEVQMDSGIAEDVAMGVTNFFRNRKTEEWRTRQNNPKDLPENMEFLSAREKCEIYCEQLDKAQAQGLIPAAEYEEKSTICKPRHAEAPEKNGRG